MPEARPTGCNTNPYEGRDEDNAENRKGELILAAELLLELSEFRTTLEADEIWIVLSVGEGDALLEREPE